MAFGGGIIAGAIAAVEATIRSNVAIKAVSEGTFLACVSATVEITVRIQVWSNATVLGMSLLDV